MGGKGRSERVGTSTGEETRAGGQVGNQCSGTRFMGLTGDEEFPIVSGKIAHSSYTFGDSCREITTWVAGLKSNM